MSTGTRSTPTDPDSAGPPEPIRVRRLPRRSALDLAGLEVVDLPMPSHDRRRVRRRLTAPDGRAFALELPTGTVLPLATLQKKAADDALLARFGRDFDCVLLVGDGELDWLIEIEKGVVREVQKGKLDPVIGRQMEIERVIQILSRRQKNNPALIGEPGVGKTAIVEGLAQRIMDRDAPAPLLDKRVLQLDVGSLVAGAVMPPSYPPFNTLSLEKKYGSTRR